MRAIGIDIGTTTISFVVLDTDGGLLESVTVPNPGAYPGRDAVEALQDPRRICACIQEQLTRLKAQYGPIDVIGVDGQMHGVLYVDEEGRAVSPLYTWQDGHGLIEESGERLCDRLSRMTGYPMATGFGLTTHFALSRLGRVPPDAACLSTIGDYAAMKLTKTKKPVCHATNAASMGLFDMKQRDWDRQAMERAGLHPGILPEVMRHIAIIGEDAETAPVACAIGDNQASFLGAVGEQAGSVLVNIGTGGQVSMAGSVHSPLAQCEERPLDGRRSLLVGSSLCGGRAYALLHRFVQGCAQLGGADADDLYDRINDAALHSLHTEGRPSLCVDTRFCGSRKNPQARGSIRNIGMENFDVATLASGVLWGMADELWAFYQEMIAAGAPQAKRMIGSGNGVRKNPALRRILRERFGMELLIPAHVEEAAFGAVLAAASALDGNGEAYARRLIRYTQA